MPYYVVPVDAQERPLIHHWLRRASNASTQIDSWRIQFGTRWAGWAILTGARSDLSVVEIEPHSAVPETLADMAYIRTPSGGRHIYFHWFPEAGADTAGQLGPGINTLGDESALVTAPPRLVQFKKAKVPGMGGAWGPEATGGAGPAYERVGYTAGQRVRHKPPQSLIDALSAVHSRPEPPLTGAV